jgi:hypothetical protein
MHLELPFEVGDRSQSLDHGARAEATREVDDQLGEDLDLNVVEVGHSAANEVASFLDGEQRLLVPRIAHNGNNDLPEGPSSAPDDVEVPVRDGVVASRADRGW